MPATPQENGDFSTLQPWQGSPTIFSVVYSTLATGQLATRQAQLESESTNIATDNASAIEAAMQGSENT